MYEKFRERDDIVFLGLTFEDDPYVPYIEQFLEQTGITWLNGYGAEATLERFKVKLFPTLYVIGTDDRIAWTGSAPTDGLEEGIEQALAKRNAK